MIESKNKIFVFNWSISRWDLLFKYRLLFHRLIHFIKFYIWYIFKTCITVSSSESWAKNRVNFLYLFRLLINTGINLCQKKNL